MPPHPSPGVGKNRLAVGFRKPVTPVTQDTAASNNAASPGGSADDAIEISSDDEDDSSEGGGMVINLADEDVEMDSDDGEHDAMVGDAVGSRSQYQDTKQPSALAGHDVDMQSLVDNTQTASGHPHPSVTTENMDVPHVVRLADLTPDELELQLKYALFDVKSEKVDLSWPAICLDCLQPGHSDKVCPEKQCVHCGAHGQHSSRLCPLVGRCSRCRERGHTVDSCNTDLKVTTVPCDLCGGLNHVEATCPARFFPVTSKVPAGSLQLWISCCICASKSHLVGDCPDANTTAGARWSLRLFAPGQVSNLSLEAGTKEREQEAANRGLRPEGMRIRGRAGLHSAGATRLEQPSDDDTDNQFFGPRVANRGNDSRSTFTFRQPHPLPDRPPAAPRGDRYDRYNAPSDTRSSQGRPQNDWYATDSFGRRRSRSPPRSGESRDVRRRSPGPAPSGSGPSTAGKAADAFKALRGGGETDRPSRGISIQLPLRRGSNAMSNQHATTDQASVSGPPAQQPKPVGGKKKPRQKKSKKTGANAQRQADLSDSAASDDRMEYDGPARRTRSGQRPDAQKVAENKLRRQYPPANVVGNFMDVVNAKRHQEGLEGFQVIYKVKNGKKGQTTMAIPGPLLQEQNLVIWKWLEAVKSLSAASNQDWEEYLQREPAAAPDHAYLIPRLVNHLGTMAKNWKKKQSLLKDAPITRVVDAFDLPTPGDNILELYLKKISMERDKAGQPPLVLEHDKNRPV